jgi:hypothetical protein
MSTPTRPVPPPSEGEPEGPGLLTAVLTVIALAPFCAVAGMLVGYKLGGDTGLFALGGALLGTLFALVIRNK